MGLGGLLVLIVATWARLSSFRTVWIDGEVLPQGGDSAYHLRRTMMTAAEFPAVPVHDPLMNWPTGGPCHWAPGMDAMGAAMVRLAGLETGEDSAALLVSVLPMILGVLVVVVAMAVCRDLGPIGRAGHAPALSAGLLVALLPQSVATGRFGRVDHHIFEVLCMALLGLWALRRARAAQGWRWELWGAAALCGGLATFAGSILYAGLATALLAGLAWSERAAARFRLVGSGAPALALAAVLSALIYGVPTEDRFSYVFPSLLQPTLLALAAIMLAAISTRRPALMALGACLAVAPILLIEGLREPFFAGLGGWLARQDPWLASIHEFQPLVQGPWLDRASYTRIPQFFGLTGILAPLVLPLGMWAAYRHNRRSGLVFAAWTITILALCLWQNRFGRVFTVNLALCAALSLDLIAHKIGARRPQVRAIALGLGLVILVGASPSTRAALIASPPRALAPLEEAAIFLRMPADIEPHASDAPGVALPWDWGHFILWLAGRPVVATGFGTYLDERGFAEVLNSQLGSEATLVDWMDRRALGYVIGGAASFHERVTALDGSPALVAGATGQLGVSATFLADRPLGTMIAAGSGAPSLGVHHLERLRPVFASSARFEALAMAPPVLWVFERVEPKVLEGTASPGAKVLAGIMLEVRGRTWPWVAQTTADASGHWSIEVPIVPGSASGGIRVAEYFEIHVDGAEPTEMLPKRRAVKIEH